MVRPLFPNFLEDPDQYARVVEYWSNLWERIEAWERKQAGWRQPWLFSGWREHAEFMDGDPIFSAWTPRERKGIRIIQYAAASEDLEFDSWLDMFGGRLGDRESVQTLVIACALSEEASRLALEVMAPWVRRADIEIDYPEVLARKDGTAIRYTVPAPFLPKPGLELAGV